MSFRDELNERIKEAFKYLNERNGKVVPKELNDINLGNDAVVLDACILYADLADSTELVRSHIPSYAASVYKAYLHCASRIITRWSGTVAAFDGDRVMGVFIGDDKESSAVDAALAINYALRFLIQDELEDRYDTSFDKLNHGIGIDSSEITVVRGGFRDANDFVWIGNAANIAAKLATVRINPYNIYITEAVLSKLPYSLLVREDLESMWTGTYNDDIGMPIFMAWYWESFN